MFNLLCFAFKHYVQTQNVQQQKLSWFSITLSNSGKSLNNSFKVVLLKLIVLTNVFETCLQNRTKLTTWIISEQAPSLRHLARNNLGCQFCLVFEKNLRWTEIHFLNHHCWHMYVRKNKFVTCNCLHRHCTQTHMNTRSSHVPRIPFWRKKRDSLL